MDEEHRRATDLSDGILNHTYDTVFHSASTVPWDREESPPGAAHEARCNERPHVRKGSKVHSDGKETWAMDAVAPDKVPAVSGPFHDLDYHCLAV